ncbi:MAG: DUF5107 domain-containing protein [Bacteroidales bacterium]|nr:DUF5107 domain-containing protein [Bacteroidales bacterium]
MTVIPAIGGKIRGAVEKSAGKEVICFNYTVKFRNIAMRELWTSGGVELNFGVIGHASTIAANGHWGVISRKNKICISKSFCTFTASINTYT